MDGEIVIVGEHGLDFEALLLRIHPAASRVKLLAERTPASYVAWDLLALGDEDLRETPLELRRARLDQALGGAAPPVHLSPATRDRALAEDWFHRFEGAGLDGVMAKRLGCAVRRRRAHDGQGQAQAHRRLRGGGLPLAQETV